MDKQNLIYSTVQIYTDKKDGTGVIMDLSFEPDVCVPVIITNKHVIEGCDDISITITVKLENGHYATQICKLVAVTNNCIIHNEYDLCAVPLSLLFQTTYNMKRMIAASYVKISELALADTFATCDAISDVYVIGYPNAYRDRKNNLPIARKGVTSTPLFSDYEGRKEFLVDCGILEGSSGSPVFIKDKGDDYKLAGIIYASKMMSVEAKYYGNKGESGEGYCWISTGIGVAIKAQEILNLATTINKIKTDILL